MMFYNHNNNNFGLMSSSLTSLLLVPLFLSLLLTMMVGKASAVSWRDCGSVESNVLYVNVPHCVSQHRCILHRNASHAIEITFEPRFPAQHVHTRVFALIVGIPVEYILKNSNACDPSYGSLSCPLVPGKHYSYAYEAFLDPHYPTLSLTVRWELQDEFHRTLLCILIPLKIV